MRIIVLGATGLIGSHVAAHLSDIGHEVAAPRSDEVDILDASTLEAALAGNVRGDDTAFDVLVNCTGHTDTDLAEREPGMAQLINADAPSSVARCCYRRGVRVVHLSTELVLGSSPELQDEDAPVRPRGIYATTKAEGEDLVLRQTDGAAVIVRTCSVYGHNGRNWSSAIAARLLDGEQVKADEVRFVTPNSAIEVARMIARIIVTPIRGIVHASAPHHTIWSAWCLMLAKALEADPDLVEPYPHPYRVARPNVRLASRRLETFNIRPMRTFPEALAEYAKLCLEVGT